ncbi:MAG TPA: histidine triad nucleotide-binding protein [Nitrospira sp.]|jgi:histidine triad (HIT) family protein|nr:histidine triad nucleotide-binding protein [Nitrospira sp.]
MNDCLFCKIIEKKIPAKIVHEDDQALAFDDINPQAPVHTLIIPKKHVVAVQDCSSQDHGLLAHLLLTCTKVAKQKGLTESGYRIVANTGRDSGQTVFHLHLHVLGGRRMAWPPG